VELKDQLGQKENQAKKVKQDRFQCPICGKRVATLVRDATGEITNKFMCEECHDKESEIH